MGEFSLFWPTGTTGDGASTYADSQLFAWLRRTFNGDNYAAQGPLVGYSGELAVTPGTGKVTIATGAAYVYGIPYELDASLDVTIPTPVANTRIDRIVLRASWTAKTVRVTRIAGTEGAGVPAITQNPGSLYDVPLAQVSVTTGGVITVTDERQFCRFATEVATENIADGAITAAKIGGGAVGTSMLADGAVTTAKLGDKAVGTAQLGDGAVRDTQVAADAAIAQSKISNTSPTINAATVGGKAASAFAGADCRLYGLQGDDDYAWAIPGPSANYSDISFRVWGGSEQTTVSFTTTGACDVVVQFSGVLKGAPGAGTFDVRAVIDGWEAPAASHSAVFTGALHFCAMWHAFQKPAGAHTVKLQFRHDQGNAVSPGIGDRYLAVQVFPHP